MTNRLVHVPDENRYHFMVDDQRAGLATYHDVGQKRVVTHTEIDPSREGQGLGSAMVSALLDDLRASGLTVVPRCSFVAAYLGRHPEYADLLSG